MAFELYGALYGIQITKVREIIGMRDLEPMPRTPAFVLGLMNLRDLIIPVLDLRLLFNLPVAARDEDSRIIVVEMVRGELGLVVDRVRGVLDLREDQIEDAPNFGAFLNTDFVIGMGKSDEEVLALLDIEAALSSEQKAAIGNLVARAGSPEEGAADDEEPEKDRLDPALPQEGEDGE